MLLTWLQSYKHHTHANKNSTSSCLGKVSIITRLRDASCLSS